MKKTVCLLFAIIFAFLSSVAFGETALDRLHTQMWSGRAWRGKYNGEVMDGLPNGYGTWEVTDKDIRFHYIGEWKDGNMHGNGGLYYWKTGEAYIGYFEDNRLVDGSFYVEGVKYMDFDTRPNENGMQKCILYREDGSVIFNGFVSTKPEIWKGGIYSSDGKMIMNVEILNEDNFADVINLFE